MSDLMGKKYGNLTAIELVDFYESPNGIKDGIWRCKCDCGNYKDVRASSLTSGSVKSCGCLKHKKKGNVYELSGLCGIGYDSNGRKFLFDLDDYDKIKKYTWYQAQNGYFRTGIKVDDKWIQIQMHRLVMNVLADDVLIDHINGDRFDNRKSNLRYATHSQNMQNSFVSVRNTSGFRGVSFSSDDGLWRARININGERVDLGSYSDFHNAVKARLNAEVKYYGEYRKPLDEDNLYIKEQEDGK